MKGNGIFFISLLLWIIVWIIGCKEWSATYNQAHNSQLKPRVIKAPSLGERSPSIEEAQKLVQRFPQSGYAHYLLGLAYYEKKEFSKAVSNLEQALKLDPAIMSAYYGLAYSYSMLGKWEKAKAAWNRLLKASPPKRDRYNAYMGLGNIALDRHGKSLEPRFLVEAEQAYQRAIWVNPLEFSAFYGLGIVAARRQQWDKAKDLFEKAFSLASTPRDKAKSLEALANIWLEKGDQKRAKRLIQQAKEIDPSYPAVLFAR